MTLDEYLKSGVSPWADCQCQKHPTPFSESDIVDVLHFYQDCPDGWDSESFAVFALKDGRFATYWEWSDSSGHG